MSDPTTPASTPASPAPAISVVDVPERRRFEAIRDGAVAGFARYVRRPDRVVFIHTEVDRAFEGMGVGSALARGALDAIRAEGLKVQPLCPFFAAYVRRHDEYADLLIDTGT